MHRNLLFAALITALFFLIFSLQIKSPASIQNDIVTTIKIQNHVPLSADAPLSFLSLLGSFEGTILLLGLFFLATKQINKSILPLTILAAGHVIEILGKNIINHPGPPGPLHRTVFFFFLPSELADLNFSYPSGHSMRVMFLFVFILFYVWNFAKFSKNTKLLITVSSFLYTALMLFSRVSLGEHWISDVIGGSLLGLALGLLAAAGLTIDYKKLKKRAISGKIA